MSSFATQPSNAEAVHHHPPSSNNNTGIIVGSVIGSLIGCSLLTIGGFFFYKWYNSKNEAIPTPGDVRTESHQEVNNLGQSQYNDQLNVGNKTTRNFNQGSE